ncbi:MAG: GNAT family N-acetyltransferase [Phycisphaerae bacterium]|nr:GNAT family N-acetyltransferase [Gemmatimonadaceae bacterium]
MTNTNQLPLFRSATGDDLAGVTALLEHAKLPLAGVAEMFAREASQFVVAIGADNSADVVAVAGVEVCCDNALLRSVAVRDDWRQQGLGALLVQRAVCEAEARGIRALYLLTMTAEHYFPRFGFETISRDSVPLEIAETLEFKSACPASTVAMSKSLESV